MLISIFGCSKFDINSDSKVNKNDAILTSRSNTYEETYSIGGQLYTLIFEENSDIPLNSNVEQQLINAIGSQEYTLTHYEEYPDISFIEPITPAVGTVETVPPVQLPPLFAEFYEHDNFQGNVLKFISPESWQYSFFEYKSSKNSNNLPCSAAYGLKDLRDIYVDHNLSSTWDDKISSFKIIRPVIQTIINYPQFITMQLHRDPNYSKSKCHLATWKISSYGNTYTVPKLSSERWCFLGARMNDEISSISISMCSNSCSCVNF